MRKFEIFDLQFNTSAIVSAVNAGEVLLVMEKEKPLFVALPMSHKLMSMSIKITFALHLFENKLLTVRRAAHVSGLPLKEFIALANEL